MSKLPDLTNACKPLPDIFASAQEREEQRKAAVAKKIIDIEIDLIDDFPDHPFHVRDDEDMMQLVESIREHGIMTPATVTRKACVCRRQNRTDTDFRPHLAGLRTALCRSKTALERKPARENVRQAHSYGFFYSYLRMIFRDCS